MHWEPTVSQAQGALRKYISGMKSQRSPPMQTLPWKGISLERLNLRRKLKVGQIPKVNILELRFIQDFLPSYLTLVSLERWISPVQKCIFKNILCKCKELTCSRIIECWELINFSNNTLVEFRSIPGILGLVLKCSSILNKNVKNV